MDRPQGPDLLHRKYCTAAHRRHSPPLKLRRYALVQRGSRVWNMRWRNSPGLWEAMGVLQMQRDTTDPKNPISIWQQNLFGSFTLRMRDFSTASLTIVRTCSPSKTFSAIDRSMLLALFCVIWRELASCGSRIWSFLLIWWETLLKFMTAKCAMLS